MLSPADNELLTDIGPGQPMGRFFRGFWMPIFLSEDLPKADGKPLRVALLGERLVAFRDSSGAVGLIQERCPHRGASFALGRNEDNGMRCVYHGWKFDRSGRCVDLPNDPSQGPMRDRIRVTAYPCEERHGIIWAWLGTGSPPPLPNYEWGLVSPSQRFVSRRVLECNWAQGLEGDIDTSHASFLHRAFEPVSSETFDRPDAVRYINEDGRPEFHVSEEPYGLMIAARRRADSNSSYWRITQFLFPNVTMPAPYEDLPLRSNVWVPLTRERTLIWTIDWHPARDLTAREIERRRSGDIGHCVDFLPVTAEAASQWSPAANQRNDYLSDYDGLHATQFSAIHGVWAQDKAVAESMGPIADRSEEHLSPSDLGIVRWRRAMLRAAREIDGPSRQPASCEAQLVRSASFVCPSGADWESIAREHARAGEGVPMHPETV